MEIRNIPILEVTPSKMNPRKKFDEDGLRELADNIRHQGLLQPITVRPIGLSMARGSRPEGAKYEVVCGERRYRAMRILSEEDCHRWPGIACIVRELSDAEAFDAMITENLQRKDVDPTEEAFAFSELVKARNTVEEIAARFGKSVRFVQDRMRLNSLIPELGRKVNDGEMPILAAMIIARLDQATQRKFLEEHGERQITKTLAQTFVDGVFRNLANTPWYRSGDKADKDFEGGCGRKCRECPYNTANEGCLFYDEAKTNHIERCTCETRFEAKHIAYMLAYLDARADELVKAGEPLVPGKTVVVDISYAYNTEAKRLRQETMDLVRARGYEVVNPNEMFAHRIYNKDSSDIKEGRAYRCIDVLSKSWLPFPDVVYYKIKDAQQISESGEIAPAEVVKLSEQHSRNIEKHKSLYHDKLCKLAKTVDVATLPGQIGEEEQLALDILLLGRVSLGFFRERYGLCKDTHFLREIALRHPEDRTLWQRDYLRSEMANGGFTSAPGMIAKNLLPLWCPDGFEKATRDADNDLKKKNGKIRARLEELGYDTEGHKLSDDKKPDPALSIR